MTVTTPEVWLRGPVGGVQPLLQPVAHALLQAREEVADLVRDLPQELLWQRPSGVASAGFHLRHLAGSLDRLFTYARGEQLSEAQLASLRAEQEPGDPPAASETLLAEFEARIDLSLRQLQAIDEGELLHARSVGRARLPSTTIGLLFHAAEHTQRHVGQLLVTVRVQRVTGN